MSDIVRSLENAEKIFHRVYQLAISMGGIYVLDVALSREIGALARFFRRCPQQMGKCRSSFMPILIQGK